MAAPPSTPFTVVFIGAGNVMFGSNEGPWNHAKRFEQKLGARFHLAALVEPDTARARAMLQLKVGIAAYDQTHLFRDIDTLISTWAGKPAGVAITAIVLGSPPVTRGSSSAPADMDLRLAHAFPHAALFIEKPVSAGVPADTRETAALLAQTPGAADRIVSVGYMLRYLRAVQVIKSALATGGLKVMATHARYACAYEAIVKPFWWDKSLSGGPVVEQGTHFCDLSRYIGGDVDLGSVQAHSLKWDEPAGALSKVGFDEQVVPVANRIPRVTSANWKYADGAVGSFLHVVGLQGTAYNCELEVFADGHLFKLIDPYGSPILRIRRPGSDAEEEHRFEDDDPFLSEVAAFVDAVDQGSSGQVLSSFADACATYELTWAIRLASERR